MGSSPSINIPPQPTYGESMADSLEAQFRALTGTGEFAKIAADAGLGPDEPLMQGLLERY